MNVQRGPDDPTEDDTLRGICFCPAPHHAPCCRIGVMLARLERPNDLFRITKIC